MKLTRIVMCGAGATRRVMDTNMQSHILSIILFTPLVGALLLIFIPKEQKDAIRWIANMFRFGGPVGLDPIGAVVLGAAL